VALFRRRRPIHRELADAAGIALGAGSGATTGLIAQPPDWTGEQRGEPGIHGVPRARRWDTVASAEAPGLRGDAVHFVALPDGTLVVDEDEPDASLTPLADALEETIAPPYRAEAVRRDRGLWAVAARRIGVATEPGLDGDEAELVVTRGSRSLTVDGAPHVARAPAFERVGEAEGPEFVVRATRLDGDLWEVEALPL
jgi:hypothetical protein